MHLKKHCQIRIHGILLADIEIIPVDTEMILVGTTTEKETAGLVATERGQAISLDAIETALENDLAEIEMIQESEPLEKEMILESARAGIETTLESALVETRMTLGTGLVGQEIFRERHLVGAETLLESEVVRTGLIATRILTKVLLDLALVVITSLATQGRQETAHQLVIPVTAKIAAVMACNRESLMTRNEADAWRK
jgi:hypothetical protein